MKEAYIDLSVGSMYYYVDGEGKPIVFLHGWGQNFYTFEKITNYFKDNYKVIGVDFIGFGNSDEPERPLTVDDYVTHLEELLIKLNITNPIIIAHSFGGRIAIKYAIRNKINKLILVSSAGIKKRNIKYYYRVYKYKMLKKLYKIFSNSKYQNLIKNSGSSDFKSATSMMKQTLSNVVNYDSKKDMMEIKVPTYLLWGIHDDVTPYSDGLKIQKLIKNSEIIPFYNSDHFCYLQECKKFISTVKNIL